MNDGLRDFRPPVSGAGLGLRRDFLRDLDRQPAADLPDFLEIAPENWMHLGGRYARDLRAISERHPLLCHGLSLSIGGQAPLDADFLQRLRAFLDEHGVRAYSEHLSYTGDHGHLYDLLPLPLTEAAVRHVADRVSRVQDVLGRRLILENVSTYALPATDMSEADFVRAVLERADCELLLDINNVYVNSINHGFDAETYLDSLPGERIRYLHIAGHYVEAEDLRIDTHGDDVCDPVWALLDSAYRRFGVRPTLLERDFNIPPLPELLLEVTRIRQAQTRATRHD